MSTQKNREQLDPTEFRVFLTRNGMTAAAFAEKHGINISNLRNFMSGDSRMPNFEARLRTIVESYEYPIELLIHPDMRLQIEGAYAF